MKFEVLVIDSSSIMNFFKYYYKYYAIADDKIIFSGLIEFLIKKIKSEEIIVIDKVFEELQFKEYGEFKNEIKNHITPSISVFS